MGLRLRILLAGAALCILLFPRPAAAVDFRLRGTPMRLDTTESLFLNWRGPIGSNDPTLQNYGELVNRLNLQLAWSRFVLGLRLDSGAWIDRPAPGDRVNHPTCRSPSDPAYDPDFDLCLVKQDDGRLINRFRNNPIYLEKIFFTYNGRDVELTVGDYYINLGRGLTLSIRKVDELGVDTTLRGAKLVVRAGPFEGVAFAGWANIQNIDEATAYYTEGRFSYDTKAAAYDTQALCTLAVIGCNDLLAGGRAGYRLFQRVTVGAHGVWGLSSRPQRFGSDDSDWHLRVAASVDAPRLTDWLAVYAEYARAEDLSGGKLTDGDAFYASATAYTRNAVFVAEFQDYRAYSPWRYSPAEAKSPVYGTLVYQQPPTLERVITQINNNTDIIGGRLRVDLRLAPEFLIFASARVAETQPTKESTDRLWEVYWGAQLRWDQGRSHMFPFIGYRREIEIEEDKLHEELIALEWDFAQALGRGWSIESQGLIWLRSKPLELPGDNTWREGNVYLSLKWAPKLVIATGYEFITIAKESRNQHNFVNASVQWNITPSTSLRLFVGGNRPGLRCISGVCRDYPAFQGARLELVLRI